MLFHNWLVSHLPQADFTINAIPGDASFRRYFRVQHNNQQYIAVDAPPASENNLAFVNIAKAFATSELYVPEVLQADLASGFLLLTDLGDDVLFKMLNQQNADNLYKTALTELNKIQQCKLELPLFDATFINNELQLFREWMIHKHLQLKLSSATEKMLQQTFATLTQKAAEQPQCCVHRDYHSRNLMVLPEQKIGILDFQDAVIGPITYDVVSLLRDCYIDWPTEQVYNWLQFFHQHYAQDRVTSFEQFRYCFDLMGIQRHLKASFIFARKWHRDNADAYLKDIPRTINYILIASKNYPELADFHDWVGDAVYAKLE